MTCKADGQKVFETEEFYTVKCEACEYYCKVPHYRQCEARHQWNREQGIDVFEVVRELDRLAKSQLGQQPNQEPSRDQNNKKPKKSMPRHRRGR